MDNGVYPESTCCNKDIDSGECKTYNGLVIQATFDARDIFFWTACVMRVIWTIKIKQNQLDSVTRYNSTVQHF